MKQRKSTLKAPKGTKSRTDTVMLAEIPVTVTRKQMKTMRLRVKPSDGGAVVLLSIPFGVSEERAMLFLSSKETWIRRALAETVAIEQKPPLHADSAEALATLLNVLIPKWEEITGLHSSGHDIRDMKSRWGSCNVKTKHLRFSLQLARHESALVEYVVLHELCHIAVPNHGERFKALLDRYMPDWKERRKRLNGK